MMLSVVISRDARLRASSFVCGMCDFVLPLVCVSVCVCACVGLPLDVYKVVCLCVWCVQGRCLCVWLYVGLRVRACVHAAYLCV